MTATRQAERARRVARSRGDSSPSIRRPAVGLQPLLAGSGLVGLLGATAYAVASVSAWLVPVYLIVVVAILTAPRGGRDSGKTRVEEMGEPSPVPEAAPEPVLPAGESAEAQSRATAHQTRPRPPCPGPDAPEPRAARRPRPPSRARTHPRHLDSRGTGPVRPVRHRGPGSGTTSGRRGSASRPRSGRRRAGRRALTGASVEPEPRPDVVPGPRPGRRRGWYRTRSLRFRVRGPWSMVRCGTQADGTQGKALFA